MPIPRFLKNGVPVEPLLSCPECHYAISDCYLTKNFVNCPVCKKGGREVKLVTQLREYPDLPADVPRGKRFPVKVGGRE